LDSKRTRFTLAGWSSFSVTTCGYCKPVTQPVGDLTL
jgi:hypothetical protein